MREGTLPLTRETPLAWFVKQSLQNLSMISVMPLILQILDHEQEVCSTTGKSHAVIPAFTFYRDRTGDEDEKQGKRGNSTSYFLAKSARL